jgi:Luciferase-like monooxygenase
MDRWGLTLPLPGLSLAEHESLVKGAEAAGYTDLWTGETAGPDGFTPLALAAAWTEKARLGTGIVGVFQRGPALLASRRSRSATPRGAASSSGSAPPRTGSSKAGTRSHSRSR